MHIEIWIENHFRAVPADAVTLNGHYMPNLCKETDPKKVHRWCLIAPNSRAVDGEYPSRRYVYRSLDDVYEDAGRLLRGPEYSTCGGVVKVVTPTEPVSGAVEMEGEDQIGSTRDAVMSAIREFDNRTDGAVTRRNTLRDIIAKYVFKIDNYECIHRDIVQRLLGDTYQDLLKDPIKNLGPNEHYVYWWNVTDYLMRLQAVDA